MRIGQLDLGYILSDLFHYVRVLLQIFEANVHYLLKTIILISEQIVQINYLKFLFETRLLG